MKILIYSPLHPSLWTNLMDAMPEHTWMIDEGIPDVQIICLHNPKIAGNEYKIYKTLKEHPYPPVFLEFWKVSLPDLVVKYPLIYTSMTNHNNYPNAMFACPMPSKRIWSEKWIGDEKNIVVLYRDTATSGIISEMKRWNLPLEIIEYKRDIPFEEWKSKFVHSRAIVELVQKNSSTVLLEARQVGIPALSINFGDACLMTYTFSRADDQLKRTLSRLTTDDNFAREWWNYYPLNIVSTHDTFNNAFIDSVELYRNSSNPLQMVKYH